MKSNKKIFNIYEIIIFMFMTTIVSSLACGFIMFRLYDQKETVVDYSKITNDENLGEFIDSYRKLIDRYYQDIDKGKLIDSAISGMLNYLDEDYTEYLNEEDSSGLLEQLHGEYEGIGIRIGVNEEGQSYVFEVFSNSPAEEAGIMVNDIFFKINDQSLEGKTSEEISTQIKYGDADTHVITFLRDGVEVAVTITRKKVTIPSIISKIIDYKNKKIGYIQIATFANTTPEQFREAIKSLNEDKIDKLIIDVRSNGGGYLESVTLITEQLLEKGKVIYSLETNSGKIDKKDTTDEKGNFKIVVLVDSASASASEILAGALRDSYGAKLVGTKTFGKGKVQETDSLSTGGIVKFTTGKWYIPSGVNIDKIGLAPDYEVVLNEKFYTNRTDENDNQLQKALEVILK